MTDEKIPWWTLPAKRRELKEARERAEDAAEGAKEAVAFLRRLMKSPPDPDTIGPGDPLYEIFAQAIETGQPVVGMLNAQTGEVIAMEEGPEVEDALDKMRQITSERGEIND